MKLQDYNAQELLKGGDSFESNVYNIACSSIPLPSPQRYHPAHLVRVLFSLLAEKTTPVC